MEGAQQVHAVRHVYRYKSMQRDFCVLLGVVFAVSGCALAVVEIVQQSDDLNSFLLLSLFLVTFGAYLLAVAFRSNLSVDGTRISLRGAFQARTMDLVQVEGFRTIGATGGWHLILRSGRGVFPIPGSFDTDENFTAWINQVPNLDDRDRAALLAKIEEQEEVGARLGDWLAKLERARRRSIGLFVVALASAVILNVAPVGWLEPFAVILMATPFAAAYLCWQSPALYAVMKKKSDPRAETSFSLIVAGLGLLFSFRGLQVISLRPLIFFMIIAGLTIAMINYQAAKSGSNRSAFLVILLLSSLYGYSSIMAVNIIFDNAKVMRYSADITGARISGDFSKSYYLRVSPWGPVTTETEISVPSSVYIATHFGDVVCFDGSRGRMNAPWYRLVSCSDPSL
jgi:hypothetical protein